MKKFTKGILIFFGAIILALGIIVHFFAPNLILLIGVNPVAAKQYALSTQQQYADIDLEHFTIDSHDGLKLKGILHKTDIEQKGTIILLHGKGSNKENFLSLSQMVTQNGYNALMIDHRAHGESGGQYCTYGFHEKIDVQSWINELYKDELIHKNIGVWGGSLGGAIGLESLANDKRIKFGIIECTYSNFNQIVHDYSGRYLYGLDLPWLVDYLIYRAGKMADFEPDETAPILAAKKITQPVFIAHGTDDNNIAFKYGKANFDNIPTTTKHFYPVNGADHNDIWSVGGNDYFQSVFDFINNVK